MRTPKVKSWPIQTKQSPQKTIHHAVDIAPIAVVLHDQTTDIVQQSGSQLRRIGCPQDSFLGESLAWCLPLPLPFGLYSMACKLVAIVDCPSEWGLSAAPTAIHTALWHS